MNGVCVVGLYGTGGVGKTSICKVLCNKFFREFQGRVCHAELGKMSEEELMREVVKKLTGTSYERLRGLKEDKMRYVLSDGIIKEAVFLALDNMSDTYSSINEAKSYLSSRLPSGSIVMVTARLLGSLIRLRPYVDKSTCMEMPELKVQEAKSLFAKSSDFKPRNEDDEQLLYCCIKKCYFRKDDGKESYHFHPLALDVLGRQLGYINPKNWRAQLDYIDKIGEDIFNQIESRENYHPIFSILRTSFDTLSPDYQMLFMDIGLFVPDYVSVDSVYSSLERTCTLLSNDGGSSSSAESGAWRWLSMMHRTPSVKDLMSRLEVLKSKSLLESLGDGIKTRIGMHDLWRAFCVAETKSGELKCRRWVYETEKRSELVETSPAGTCWENVERMALRRGSERVNFSHFSNVKVLKISGLCLTENLVVDLSRLCRLKSLEVSGRHLHRLVLRGLSNDLIFMSFVPDLEFASPSRSLRENWESRLNSQQLIRQIECLKDVQFLWLDGHEGDKLPDMRSMLSMRWAIFSSCENVVKVAGLSSKLTNLRVLDLRGCKKLRSCAGVGDLVNLEELNCKGCERLESLPHLGKLRNLRKLEVSGCPLIMEVPGLGDLDALEELYAGQITSWHLHDDKALYCFELPDLHQLKNLRVLRLLRCHLRSCPGVGDLINLEELNCSRCESLETLPNLESLTKLRKLDISGCPFIKEVQGLGALVALEELVAGTDFYDLYYDSYSLKLPDMRKLRNLRVLRLPRCRLEAVPGFESLTSLQEMEADFGEVVDRPNALRQPMQLQKLRIRGWSLDGMKGLHNLAMLRGLDIRQCSGVEKLPDFRSLTSLQKLSIMNCKIKDVCGLSNLSALETLVIENCEFEDMLRLCNTLETLVMKECSLRGYLTCRG